jgi:hypothetical protein
VANKEISQMMAPLKLAQEIDNLHLHGGYPRNAGHFISSTT